MKDKIDTPIHVTDAEFDEKVLQSTIPVIVDFWAEWCAPCKIVAPQLERLAKEHAGEILIAKVNVDKNQQQAIKYGVQGIPTMLFVSKGKIAYRQVGAVSAPILYAIVNEFMDVTEA